MLQLNIKTNLNEFQKTISRAAYEQIPFATAQALTALAKRVAEAEKENEAKVLDRPKPFTQNALGVVGASKKRQTAIVFMKDITAAYLEPYEFGGKNKLNSKAVLTPVEAVKDLDQYGNLPAKYLSNMRGRSDVFIGPVKTKKGIVNGMWQRAEIRGRDTTRIYKIKGRLVIRKVAGYVPSREGRRLKLLFRFTDAHEARQHLGWFSIADRTVKRHFAEEMNLALRKALATAKK